MLTCQKNSELFLKSVCVYSVTLKFDPFLCFAVLILLKWHERKFSSNLFNVFCKKENK